MRLKLRLRRIPRPLARLAILILWVWAKSLRVKVVDPVGLTRGEWHPPCIFVIWHNRLVLAPLLAPPRARAQIRFLASLSKDGEHIAALLRELGMDAVRGSTSRGGAKALLQLRECLAAGQSVAITPDGPRGPRYRIQEGVLWLAQRTGAPIVPVSLNVRRHWELRSWDRTQIPCPFAKAEFVVGEPLYPVTTGPDTLGWRRAVQQQFMAITRFDGTGG